MQIKDISNTRADEDKILLKKISTGDTDAVRDLYNQYSQYLYNIVHYILKSETESEDILQEVFILIWEKSEMYNENLGTPISWIVRITRNKSIDKLRSKSFKIRENESDIERFYHLGSEQIHENPESVLTLKNVRNEINTALNSLTDVQKELLEFAYFRGYSQSELAEHFEMPLGTVKTCIRTAMIKLRSKLKHLIS